MWTTLAIMVLLGLYIGLTRLRSQQAIASGLPQRTTGPFAYLDGLRGVAAFVVVINHCLFAFYPCMLELYRGRGLHNRFELSVPFSGVNWLFSGSFAVAIFFVLSGFVLSVAYFKNPGYGVVLKGMLKRYIRLVMPVSFISLVSYGLLQNGLYFNQAAAAITGSGWLGGQFLFSPTLQSYLKETFVTIFVSKADSQYNFVLWTMHVEFIGSFIVFGLLLLLGQFRGRYLGYLVLAAALVWKNHAIYTAFVAGIALCDGYFNRPKVFGLPQLVLLLLLGVALFLGNIPIGLSDDPVLFARSWYQPLLGLKGLLPYYSSRDALMLWMVMGAVALLYVLLGSPWLKRFFSLPLAVGLGRVSFMLYLVHGLVLFSLGSWVFTQFHPQGLGAYNLAAMVSSVTVMLVSLGLACGLTVWVDDTAIVLSNRFASACMKGYKHLPWKRAIP